MPRPDTEHHLQIDPEHLSDLVVGEKTYELRERRDRDFQVGDVLVFTHDRHEYRFRITHVGTLERAGVEGWNVLSLKRVEVSW